MCSIAGIISPSPIAPSLLQAMNAAMRHRGPDGEGYYAWNDASTQIGFAHNRLRVIDTSAASDQPFRYRNRYVLVYNGEIYNYRELRNQLRTMGHAFHTEGDTEVLAAAYAAWGEACLEQLDGMFAFAIWDEQEKQFFAGRDRFGEKPFYYHYDAAQQRLIFASEIKGLLAAGMDASVNHAMLYNYLTLGHTKQVAFPENTFYQHIFQLPPAHFITMKAGEAPAQARYFDLDKETRNRDDASTVKQEFSQLLIRAVDTRLRSDLPCGTSLSGGIDSSAIAALCHQLGGKTFAHRAFSAVFPGFEKDESPFIEQVAQSCQLESFTTTPDARSFADNLLALVRCQDEPFGSASVFAQWCVYRLARENGVTVLLDGQGADEVLGGYTKYTHWFLQEQVRAEGWAKASEAARAFQKNGFMEQWGWRNRMAAIFPAWTAMKLRSRAVKEQKNNPYIDEAYRRSHAHNYGIFKPIVEKLNDIQYHDLMVMGLEELLRYADRNAMAHSREVRLPFLQHQLVQFVLSTPSSYRYRDGYSKWMLRETVKTLLPKALVWRSGKIGFEPPQQIWMQDAAVKSLVMEGRKKLVDRQILKPGVLHQPVRASDSHAAHNFDFRCMIAGAWLP